MKKILAVLLLTALLALSACGSTVEIRFEFDDEQAAQQAVNANANAQQQPPIGGNVETPVSDAPATEAPSMETPVTEAPATETPATEPPATEPPATETPATDAPTTAANVDTGD